MNDSAPPVEPLPKDWSAPFTAGNVPRGWRLVEERRRGLLETTQALVMEGKTGSYEFCEGVRAVGMPVCHRRCGAAGMKFTSLRDNSITMEALNRTVFPCHTDFTRLGAYVEFQLGWAGEICVFPSDGGRRSTDYRNMSPPGAKHGWGSEVVWCGNDKRWLMAEKVSIDFVLLEEFARNWATVAHMRKVQKPRCLAGQFFVKPLRGGGWSVPSSILVEFLEGIPASFFTDWQTVEVPPLLAAHVTLVPFAPGARLRRDADGMVRVGLQGADPNRDRWDASGTSRAARDRVLACPRVAAVFPETTQSIPAFGGVEHRLPHQPLCAPADVAGLWRCAVGDIALRTYHLQWWLLAKATLLDAARGPNAQLIYANDVELDAFNHAMHTLTAYAALERAHVFPAQWRLIRNRGKHFETVADLWKVWGEQLEQLGVLLGTAGSATVGSHEEWEVLRGTAHIADTMLCEVGAAFHSPNDLSSYVTIVPPDSRSMFPRLPFKFSGWVLLHSPTLHATIRVHVAYDSTVGAGRVQKVCNTTVL